MRIAVLGVGLIGGSVGLAARERGHEVAGWDLDAATLDAETHDRLMAVTSHLPHVLANVLVDQAGARLREHGAAVPRLGPSLRDATRVAGANPAIWRDIFMSNAETLASEIRELSRDLA